MIRISDIIEKVLEYNPNADTSIIDRAYIFSAIAHEGQERLSGEPYLTHPLSVANILADIKLDVESIAAALLHDILEDTKITDEEIEKTFGKSIYNIVAGVTKISKSILDNPKMANVESLRRMFLAMSNDIRVILIKLADRLHNMQTLQYHTEDKQKRIAQETLDIYAPIASRLGMYNIKTELEKKSFQYVAPEEYRKIETLINKDKESRKKHIEEVKGVLWKKLEENKINGTIKGRYKEAYSIYKKKISQNLEYDDIYDIIAFRIVLDSIADCYQVYGVLHNNWNHVEGKAKDYIGNPKSNMYRSLHTTIIYKGERIEIQIRTQEMNELAESGIAAHWSYKEGKKVEGDLNDKFVWLQNIIENQQDISSGDPEEFLENIKVDLFSDEVYTFTPQGEVKILPDGATPVDFAYLIHTEIGESCYGAKVSNKMVNLDYKLQNGDTVEIITSKMHKPSKKWIRFVKTTKAKAKIRHWIRAKERGASIELGKEMCEKGFAKEKVDFAKFLKSETDTKTMLRAFNFINIDDLFVSIAYGKTTPNQLIKKVFPASKVSSPSKKESFSKTSVTKNKSKYSVIVSGFDDDNMLIKKAKCCKPTSEGEIVGYISQGAGIIIHSADCINIKDLDPARIIEVEWDKKDSSTMDVVVQIHSYDKTGLLSEITSTISKHDINIKKIKSSSTKGKSVVSMVTLRIKNQRELTELITDLRKSKSIVSIKRV